MPSVERVNVLILSAGNVARVRWLAASGLSAKIG